jgi:hypothetical protein
MNTHTHTHRHTHVYTHIHKLFQHLEERKHGSLEIAEVLLPHHAPAQSGMKGGRAVEEREGGEDGVLGWVRGRAIGSQKCE